MRERYGIQKKLFGEREGGTKLTIVCMSNGVAGENYLVSYCNGHEVIQTTKRQNLYTPTVALVFCPTVSGDPTANRLASPLVATMYFMYVARVQILLITILLTFAEQKT